MGHVRDLPERKLAIDIDNDFAPTYQIIPERKDVVGKRLRAAAKGASEVYLASDPDREGEAISWHLKEALGTQEAPSAFSSTRLPSRRCWRLCRTPAHD